MKRFFYSTERGQALIIMALAAIGLFAIVGLAIDGSAKFSDRRHAQNAADTAALAAALSASRGAVEAVWTTKARAIAGENGYTGDLIRSQVWVYKCNKIAGTSPVDCGPYNGSPEHIQVVIRSYINTYFARVMGINQTQNLVEAVALVVAEDPHFNFGGNAIVALRPSSGNKCALVTGGNNQTTIIGGGLFSNSSDPTCAYNQNGCAGNLEIDNGLGTLTTVGGMSLITNCSTNINAQLVTGAQQMPFPPKIVLPAPAECSQALGSPSVSGTTATYSPGHYASLKPSGSVKNILLTPGIYCVDTQAALSGNETIKIQGTYGITPGVFIYFKAGGSSAPISLQGGDIQLWPQTAGTYANYLMYVAPNYNGSPTSCTINGNSNQILWGTIYAPYCDFKINGTSTNGFHSQVIGYTVDLSGSANITVNYNPDKNGYGVIPAEIGMMR
jgi:hypothetical protein